MEASAQDRCQALKTKTLKANPRPTLKGRYRGRRDSALQFPSRLDRELCSAVWFVREELKVVVLQPVIDLHRFSQDGSLVPKAVETTSSFVRHCVHLSEPATVLSDDAGSSIQLHKSDGSYRYERFQPVGSTK
jgi:hypothetical protein